VSRVTVAAPDAADADALATAFSSADRSWLRAI
jgi:thiamine biosynthesis lipoprotein ApbE